MFKKASKNFTKPWKIWLVPRFSAPSFLLTVRLFAWSATERCPWVAAYRLSALQSNKKWWEKKAFYLEFPIVLNDRFPDESRHNRSRIVMKTHMISLSLALSLPSSPERVLQTNNSRAVYTAVDQVIFNFDSFLFFSFFVTFLVTTQATLSLRYLQHRLC